MEVIFTFVLSQCLCFPLLHIAIDFDLVDSVGQIFSHALLLHVLILV